MCIRDRGSTDTAMLNAVTEHKWLQANRDLWSVLLLTTSGSANNTVKKFEGKRPDDEAGHGQLAWKALTEKCNGHTKEARRACHEKLVNTKMEPGQDPDEDGARPGSGRHLFRSGRMP